MIPYRLNPLGISVNENIPLTLTAQQAGSTVTLNATGSPTVSGLHYRRGKSGEWLSYTIGTTVTLDNIGDSVQFWNSADRLSSGTSNYVQFVLTGTVQAFGNTMSLLNYSRVCSDYCLVYLFSECRSLTLPAELPAPTLASGCYQGMFYNCSGLLNAPVLPAVTLTARCYRTMFWGCSSLVYAPVLPAAVLQLECCQYMFYSCSSLASVNVAFTDWNSANNSTYYWLYGVSASGTFTKPNGLPEENGESRIPSGWTVVNK